MIPEWARKVFGHESDEALGKLAEREACRKEIENTRWYRMLLERLEQEALWTDSELRRVGIFNFERLQAYSSAVEMLANFVKGTKRTGEIASELLGERAERNKKKSVDEWMEEIMGVHE